ncbi:hypothetical protein JQC91_06160 [Jannaschia sp. Os4]|uniref:hypothetical protein n=1 Tax=Jannaschia sp. Os4 TaxID=2807617 RepID=UPI00193A7788|nr:hypothetical protein [Jannaschia sp. Os4]MBM2575881.1 hypothetical protein [Jannaschia sp. Os4]
MRALVLLLALAAQPAHALSCLRPEPARTFAEADASPAGYRIARGTLAPPEGWTAPASEDPGAPDRRGYAVEATGALRFATRDGWSAPRPVRVTIEVGCVAHWCGAPPAGEAVLFLRDAGGTLVLDEAACPMWSFPATPEVLAELRRCVRGACG